MFTCTKRYSDLPFAHRQHNHKGHCSLIHGHNWGFEFTFGAHHRDENGFVIDFGDLKWLKKWLETQFDHTLLLNEDDPHLPHLLELLCGAGDNPSRFAKIVIVPNASSEGLAHWVWTEVARLVNGQTEGRVALLSVMVIEDEKNSATFSIQSPTDHV